MRQKLLLKVCYMKNNSEWRVCQSIVNHIFPKRKYKCDVHNYHAAEWQVEFNICKAVHFSFFFLIWRAPYSRRLGLIGSDQDADAGCYRCCISDLISIFELFVHHNTVQPMHFAPAKINHFGHCNTNWSRVLPILWSKSCETWMDSTLSGKEQILIWITVWYFTYTWPIIT